MTDTWEELKFEQQELLIKTMSLKALAKKFDHKVAFFQSFKQFVDAMPEQTVPPTAVKHNPHKDLVVSARRDLSFFEANFELIDNSIDAWRRGGVKSDLKIDITYDLELSTGKYTDNAGGLDENDVYKVFIPGETTNRNLTQKVIGSFGMGAKKGIFRLTDGAKIISCKNSTYSCTSQVPEKWETNPNWDTEDGRAKPTVKGRTELYFFKLFAPPSNTQIAELVQRCSILYRPLIAEEILEKKLFITVNKTRVKAGRAPLWSGAKGAAPCKFIFAHTFENFLETGHNVQLGFEFICGLTQRSAGKDSTERDEDWGIDVFGNGRLIQRFRKSEFGFGTEKGLGKRSSAMNYLRGELFIDGHSFAIPWDTHKREYLKDHVVSEFLRQRLLPVLVAYKKIANRFGNKWAKDVRSDYLAEIAFEGEFRKVQLSDPPAKDELPKFAYSAQVEAAKVQGKKHKIDPEEDEEGEGDAKGRDEDHDDEDVAEIVESEDEEISVEFTLTRAERDGLMNRFGVDDEDELATALEDCVEHGIAFGLTNKEFKAAKKALQCVDAHELSQKVKTSFVAKLGK